MDTVLNNPPDRTPSDGSLLDNVVIVLSHTTEPANIGAACRAMKTMGLNRLRLINPLNPKGRTARSLAHGAEDVLETAEIVFDIETAIADARVIAGTTGRMRALRKHALLSPRSLAERLVNHAAEGTVALLFGSERIGLTNDEVNVCRYLSSVDTATPQPSLNLAQAVMLYAWEIQKEYRRMEYQRADHQRAGNQQTTQPGSSPSDCAEEGLEKPGEKKQNSTKPNITEPSSTKPCRTNSRITNMRHVIPNRPPEMYVCHPHRSTKLPTQFELDMMYAHLAGAMEAIGYSEFERRKFITSLRHLHMRAGIVDWELQIYHLLARRILKISGRPKFTGED